MSGTVPGGESGADASSAGSGRWLRAAVCGRTVPVRFSRQESSRTATRLIVGMHPNEAAVRDRWRSLRREHAGLDGWTLIINGRMRSAMGRCKHTPREVHLARWHIEQSDAADVLDTLLHEAAHALAPERGHGREWKAWARRLGATPRARGHCRNREQVAPKWRVECMDCGIVFERRLRRRGWRHLHHECPGGGRGRLRWIDRRKGGRPYIGYDPNRGRRRLRSG